MNAYQNEINTWRESADKGLRRENGWLALAGLFWLKDGENTLGSAEENDLVLPRGAERLGSIHVENGDIRLIPRPDSGLLVDGETAQETLLKADISGEPTVITLGDLTMILIEREVSLGIRMWDNSREERTTFSGRQWYPIDESYRVQATFVPDDSGIQISVLQENVSEITLGILGTLNFTLHEQELSLLTLDEGEETFRVIFRDATSGSDTYPSGRYLIVPKPENGVTTMDFNRAYSPPCAFTPFATCALPPRQNWLEVAITAGEKRV